MEEDSPDLTINTQPALDIAPVVPVEPALAIQTQEPVTIDPMEAKEPELAIQAQKPVSIPPEEPEIHPAAAAMDTDPPPPPLAQETATSFPVKALPESPKLSVAKLILVHTRAWCRSAPVEKSFLLGQTSLTLPLPVYRVHSRIEGILPPQNRGVFLPMHQPSRLSHTCHQ